MVRINLLPDEYRAQPQINPLRVLIMLGSVIALLSISVGGIVCVQRISQLKSEIKSIDQEREAIGPLYQQVLDMEASLAQVQAKLASMNQVTVWHLRPTEILKAFNSVVPDSVSVATLGVQPGGALSISGSSTNYYSVAAFQLKLIETTQFGSAILASAGGDETITFSISTTYHPLPAAAPGAATAAPGQITAAPAAPTAVSNQAAAQPAAPTSAGSGTAATNAGSDT